MQFVSVHGGHSGQFCNHAIDNLEDIVQKYIELNYTWVGITEHAPGISKELLYPDEKEAGFTPDSMLATFDAYMTECRRLQKKYADKITLYPAMEIETYNGYESFVPMLLERFKPDYIVGSLHFLGTLGFDYSPGQYEETAKALGGYDKMYCLYFDQQYEMIERLQPAVVGHFDLIRIYDKEYRTRLQKKEISKRIERNLELISKLDLIMDFNLRALHKGAEEPYITEKILQLCREMTISVVPGDDSHGCGDIHRYTEAAMTILKDKGFTTDWPRPKINSY